MEWRGLNDLREQFLSFFESKQHTRMASASLVPQGDKSLLLINSGMAPLKKYFLGQAVPPNVRVTTCQKCIRTPDIENVGKTARHGTYFEMLGNFSFGDYFKRDAIRWAWEFFTDVLEMPKELLHCSVFENDDEAYDIWTKEIGVDPSHMVRMGREDNFWEHGSGPCGPCSEIYFDRGPEKGCGRPDCHVGCECDRYVEVWNLVFSQFDSDGNGHYAEMEHKNIDTGMGLERLACVMQGVDNLFEVDTVQNIMKHISRIAGITYHEDAARDVSLRVITDHIRSTTFMVGDGVLPSNEGRGYVLRRLLRRAARHGRMIGIKGTFLHEVCDTVIDENRCAYPELEEKRAYIKKIIQVEEETFAKTIDRGLELLNECLDKADKQLSGEDAFRLSDTYGFPYDLTVEIAAERGMTVDEAGYRALVQKQRATAKADHLAKASSSWADDSVKLDVPKTEFVGYKSFSAKAKILAILCDNTAVEAVDADTEGKVTLILDTTPFYAESGGQVADTGEIRKDGEDVFEVSAVTKDEDGHYLHHGHVAHGSCRVGDAVEAEFNWDRRQHIMRNHTAAHLLQAALRQVLGEHVHQAGQLVNDAACRFDFSHFSAMTTEEIRKVEQLVNQWILEAIPVEVNEMPIEEARKLGAMALFGEKYGDIVRVVEADGVSIEFCGGTHVANTAHIGLFRIVSESSVASGVRRIEAVTGNGVLALLDHVQGTLNESAKILKIGNPAELPAKCAALTAQLRATEKTVAELRQKLAGDSIADVMQSAKDVNGVRIAAKAVEGANADMLRNMGDRLKDTQEPLIAVLAGTGTEKAQLYCVCSKAAVAKGAHAGKIVQKLAALTGGKGGGRPDSAMAGIGDAALTDTALAALESVAAEFLK